MRVVALMSMALSICFAAETTRSLVYIGTYTAPGKSAGIYVFRFDSATGAVEDLGLAAETANPSFVAIHPNKKFLYAVAEGGKEGAVSAFSVDQKTGKLTFLNKVSSGGAGPCFVAVDHKGANVLVANYGGGSIAVLPLEQDGRLRTAAAFIQHRGSSVDEKRQAGPHAHSINVSPDNRFAIAADLGLDRVLVYRFDAAKGALAPNEPPYAVVEPGSGPRHFAFHPSGKHAYVINEMASTVTAFEWNGEAGSLKPVQTISTLPAGYKGNTTTAEVQVHPNGRFLYGSNRGHDSIAAFAIDPAKGTLKLIGHTPTEGNVPRNFGIDPSGQWLWAANQRSDNVVLFRIDAATGELKPAGKTLKAGMPVCVRFLALE